MNKENRFVIQVDPLEIEDDAIFDNKELKLYECQSDMMSDICSLLNKQDQQISDLEAKLAEKDKEITYLTKQAKKLNNEAQKYFEDAYCNDFQKQTKIDFAVEQLKKVKEFVSRQLFITTKGCSDLDEAEAKGCNELREETIKEIDNQIEELKNEMK